MSKQPIFLRVVKDGKVVEMKQFNNQQIVIGRSGEVTLAINDQKVGPIHCMIEERDGGFYLCDLGTEFGTFVEGEKIVEKELKTGAEFKVGESIIEFHVGIPKPFKAHDSHAEHKAVEIKPVEVKPEQKPASKPLAPSSVKPTPVPYKAPEQKASPAAPPTKAKTTVTQSTKGTSVGAGMSTVQARVPHTKKGTFAPPSAPRVKENLKPSQGTVVEVVLFWKDRVLSTHHYDEHQTVKIGSHPDNEIILPIFGSVRLSHPLLQIDSVAKVFLTSDMTGEVVKKDGSKVNFNDMKKFGSIQPSGTLYVYQLQQNEMLKIQIGEGVEIIIRYVGAVPKATMAPVLNATPNQITAVIVMLLLTFLFIFYVFLYAPPAPEKKEEETIPPRKAQFFYKKPAEELKPVELSPEPKKTAKTNQPPIKDKEVAPERGEEGAAQEAAPNKSQSKKQILTATKAGKDKGIVKANSKPSEAPKTVARDVRKTGVLSVFGTKGVQDQLNKAFQGSGNVAGLSQGATGQAGEAAGAGNDTGRGLKEIGMGGNGTATVGIAGVKTKGRGGGIQGYGTGGLGAKKNATILAGGDDSTVSGSIDKDAIRRVVQANLKQIKACYEKGLNKDPSLYGKMVIQWTIGAGGNVLEAGIKSTTLNSPEVEKCSVARLKSWKFPEPPVNEVAVVSYPFVLQGQE